MKKIVVLLVCCLVIGCSGVKKPPLAPTQIVDGKSIVIPPEFDIVPETAAESPENK